MKTLSPNIPEAPLSQRLRERVEHLGLCMVLCGPRGRLRPLGRLRWLDRLLLRAAPFQQQVAQSFSPYHEEATAIWPGVWLIPLAEKRRRRHLHAQSSLPATLLISPTFLGSDQFRLMCSAAGVDVEAALVRIDPADLVGDAEVGRLTSLLGWLREDAAEVDRRVTDLQGMSRELATSYEELSLLYQLAASMTVDQPPSDFLQQACEELQQVIGLDWMALQLVDTDARLKQVEGRLFFAGELELDEAAACRLCDQLARQHSDATRPIVIDDTTSLCVPRLNEVATTLLVVPLRRANQTLGLLFGGSTGGRQITSREATLCDSLGSNLTMFLQNAMLYEDMQGMFFGTLHALTSAIDAKDRYTHGHSERVAALSRTLAHHAGYEVEICDRVYLAGLVHDVGKIGVPEAVLSKKGRLNPDEFEQMKRHPEIGARILQGIRQMGDLIPGVLHHHERWTGRGYPHGLAGDDIPLFGRIIALADAFDAMSTDRTYRGAFSREKVLCEVREGTGTQFDPALAEVFLSMDLEWYHRCLAEAAAAAATAA